MNRENMWTDGEIAIVREHYPIGGARAVAEQLPHRTLSAIGFKAFSLGVKAGRHARAAGFGLTPWTEADSRTLREAYARGGASAAQIALPHRSKTAIRTQASKLGISHKAGGPKPKWFGEAKVTAPPVKPGPCDRGDRERIRRRMPYVIADLARELNRTPDMVYAALAEMAKKRFEPDALAKLSVDPASAHATSSEGAV